jgi:hypothetical protein
MRELNNADLPPARDREAATQDEIRLASDVIIALFPPAPWPVMLGPKNTYVLPPPPYVGTRADEIYMHVAVVRDACTDAHRRGVLRKSALDAYFRKPVNRVNLATYVERIGVQYEVPRIVWQLLAATILQPPPGS